MGGFVVAVGARGCSAGPQAGALALCRTLCETYGERGARSNGIFNCRKIAGTETWSLHAEGRAIDLEVGWPPAAVGLEIREKLVQLAGELGLQRVIYDSWIFDASHPNGAPFSDGGAHRTHLHIELGWVAARTLTDAHCDALLAPLTLDEDGPVVLLRRLAEPTDTAVWLLSGGKRIALANWTNVQALIDGGAVMISLPDATLAGLPAIGGFG